MRALLVLLVTVLAAAASVAGDLSPKDLVAQLYQAHKSKHDPLNETRLLSHYFDDTLLRLYLKDRREAKNEVGRLDGDPLYNAQDFEIKGLSISPPEVSGHEARVTVTFKNMDKPTRIVFVLGRAANGWKISDIRYDDGSSLKKILEGEL
jgi:hypothetical protein